MRKHVADGASGATRTVHYLLDTSAAHAQVAARATTAQELGGATRTARSVFHWGAGSGAASTGLIRQEHWADGDTGPSTPTALLLPLPGHLGTSLGAVDAHGQVVETIGQDAFGQRTDASAAAQSHRFAGEYWDEDAQLVYLRARWYDPRLGRFISGDPFEGRQQDPRSLNRYGYAHNDPMHNADPSGAFSIGEMGAGMNVQGVLANVARHEAIGFLQDRILGGSDVLDGPPSLYEMLLATLMRTLATSAPEAQVISAGMAAIAMSGSGTDRHHSIPIYMCGRLTPQERVLIPRPSHRVLHKQLIALDTAIRVAGYSYRVIGKRRK